MNSRLVGFSLALFFLTSICDRAPASDWPRFRGPNGAGISADSKPTPVEWGDTKNLKWKAALPGPGSSSPIVVGDRVFVTCWSGYGADARNPGDQKDLKRHLVCIDRKTGAIAWSKAVDAQLPEDRYQGMFAENGYASHSPVSDGERVYVFLGKTGVVAFDMQGAKLWERNLGTGSDPRGWGSASSPILYKNLVIVTASAESEALVALDKLTGKEVWRKEASGFGGTWGTPVLVDVDKGRTELVLAVPFEFWGFNPDTGKLLWYCDAISANSMCSSVVAQDGIIYGIEQGPGGGGAIAVRAGGSGNVTKTHILWQANLRSRIATPIVHDGRLYYISGGVANCADSKTGNRIYQSRIGGGAVADAGRGGSFAGPPGDFPPAGKAGPPDKAGPAGKSGPRGRGGPGGPAGPGGRGFAGGRGGRGGMGGQDYSSPVAANGKLYFVARSGLTSVLALGPDYRMLAQNQFKGDSNFSGSPAISDGELFIRSNKYLYCVAETAATPATQGGIRR